MYLLCGSDDDLFQAAKAISNHHGGKHIFTSSWSQRQTEGGAGFTGNTQHPSSLSNLSPKKKKKLF